MALDAGGSPAAKPMADLRSATPPPANVNPAAPEPVPIAKAAPVSPTPATPPAPKPATDFHQRSSDVLDLSHAPIAPRPPQVIEVPVATEPAVKPTVVTTPAVVTTTATTTPVELDTVKSEVEARRRDQLENAQAITQSPAISKFHSVTPVVAAPEPVTPPVATPSTPQPEPPAAQSATVPVTPPPAPITPPPVAPAEVPSVTPEPPSPPSIAAVHPSTPVGPVSPTGPTSTITNPPVHPQPLPGVAVGQIQANRRLVPKPVLASVDPEGARGAAFTQKLAKAPPRRAKPAAVAAAVAVVAILGGYIWLQNYPKLAIRSASNRAGFTASVPTYLPSGFSLNHNAATQPGLVALTFSSIASADNITITQRPTDWDSQSLLANYVADQSPQHLSVNQQGLTIYLYNGNQASWVNQGIWYSIGGHNHLNRDQLLKIINGL